MIVWIKGNSPVFTIEVLSRAYQYREKHVNANIERVQFESIAL